MPTNELLISVALALIVLILVNATIRFYFLLGAFCLVVPGDAFLWQVLSSSQIVYS